MFDRSQAEPKARQALERRIAQTLEQRGRGVENIQLVEPAMPITWGGEWWTRGRVFGVITMALLVSASSVLRLLLLLLLLLVAAVAAWTDR